MKFLDVPPLATFSNTYLNNIDLGTAVVQGSIEAYSCKRTHSDKKNANELADKVRNGVALSPALSSSPLGPLTQGATVKLLADLIAALSSTFPDYDFRDVQPSQFAHDRSLNEVMSTLNQLLFDSLEKLHPGITEHFWTMLDDCVQPRKCDIYRFLPDDSIEDFISGREWFFVYFFVNKDMKKIVIFTASATSNLHAEKKQATRSSQIANTSTKRMNESDIDEEEVDWQLDDVTQDTDADPSEESPADSTWMPKATPTLSPTTAPSNPNLASGWQL